MSRRPLQKKGMPRPPLILRTPILSAAWRWLCWVTNNEVHPKHEVEFDIVFFIINTLTVVFGCYYMFTSGPSNAPFAALLVIEWTWALDTIRNNRDYIK